MSFGGKGGGSRASERETRSGRSRGTRTRSRSRSSIRLLGKTNDSRRRRWAFPGRASARRQDAAGRDRAAHAQVDESPVQGFALLDDVILLEELLQREALLVEHELSRRTASGPGGGRERQRGKARVLGTSTRGSGDGFSRVAARREAPRRRVAAKGDDGARSRGRGGGGRARPAGLRRAPRARPAEDPRGRALVPAGEIRTPGVPARGRDRARSRGASNAPRRERTVPAPATSKTSRRADRTRARCVRAPSRSAAPPRTARALKTRRQIARQKGRQGEKGGRRSRRPIGAADRRSVRNRNRRFKIETDAQRLVYLRTTRPIE